jgi:hypothetical protein
VRAPRAVTGLLVLAGAVFGAGFFADNASAYVYWSNLSTIGRAANDGSAPDSDFIPYDGAGAPICAVAVDAAHIYWSTLGGDIGRANINGTGADWQWIDRSSGNTCGLAVSSSGVYVADGYQTAGGSIGRSDLAGTGVSPLLSATAPCGLAVSGDTLIWQTGGSPGTFGKSSASSPGLQPFPVSGDNGYCSLAAGEGSVFYNAWYSAAGDETPISRVPIGGTAPQLITSGSDPKNACGLAYSAGYVYWKQNGPTYSIGRVRSDGGVASQPGLVSGASVAEGCGIAADELPAPDTTITSGPSGTTSDATPTFAFSGSPAADADHFECRIDAGAFALCASPQTTAALADGPHTFAVRAVDVGSNGDPSPATRAFTVQTGDSPACAASKAALAEAKQATAAAEKKVDKAKQAVDKAKSKHQRKKAKKHLKAAKKKLKQAQADQAAAQAAADAAC